jgi:DNA-binding beta-propeller fold protein YncE
MVFTTLAFSQVAHVIAIRSSTDSVFTIGRLSNRWLAAAVAGTVLLQLVVVYVPVFNRLFDTVPLSGVDVHWRRSWQAPSVPPWRSRSCCGAVAVNPVTNTIYVANRLSDKVTVIDGHTNRAVQR